MNCPSCGSNVNQGEMFCRVCGTKIEVQPIQQNVMGQPNYVQNESNMQQQVMNNNVGYTQPAYNSYSNDEDLINAYIGENVDKLKYGGFSVNTFFLGSLYVLYRKMWLLGIVWILVDMIVSIFLSVLYVPLTLVTKIIIAAQFKKWYLKHVEEQVAKIKAENAGASHEQLLTICSKKGGTTIIPIIIFVIIYVLIFICAVMLVAIPSILNEVKEKAGTVTGTTESGDIGDLSLTVPATFEKSNYNTDSYKSYSMSDDNDNCRLSINTTNASYYDSANAYLEKTVIYSASDKVSKVETKNINGNNWASMSVEKSYSKTYYYVGQKDDKLYAVEFSIIDDSGTCSSAHSTVINSLKFN